MNLLLDRVRELNEIGMKSQGCLEMPTAPENVDRLVLANSVEAPSRLLAVGVEHFKIPGSCFRTHPGSEVAVAFSCRIEDGCHADARQY